MAWIDPVKVMLTLLQVYLILSQNGARGSHSGDFAEKGAFLRPLHGIRKETLAESSTLSQKHKHGSLEVLGKSIQELQEAARQRLVSYSSGVAKEDDLDEPRTDGSSFIAIRGGRFMHHLKLSPPQGVQANSHSWTEEELKDAKIAFDFVKAKLPKVYSGPKEAFYDIGKHGGKSQPDKMTRKEIILGLQHASFTNIMYAQPFANMLYAEDDLENDELEIVPIDNWIAQLESAWDTKPPQSDAFIKIGKRLVSKFKNAQEAFHSLEAPDDKSGPGLLLKYNKDVDSHGEVKANLVDELVKRSFADSKEDALKFAESVYTTHTPEDDSTGENGHSMINVDSWKASVGHLWTEDTAETETAQVVADEVIQEYRKKVVGEGGGPSGGGEGVGGKREDGTGIKVVFDPASRLVSYKDKGGCGKRSKGSGTDEEVEAELDICGSPGAKRVAEMQAMGDNVPDDMIVDGCEYFRYTVYTCNPLDPWQHDEWKTKVSKVDATKTFKNIDKDQDGTATIDEIKTELVGGQTTPKFTDEEAQHLIREICQCNGATIDKCEIDQASFEKCHKKISEAAVDITEKVKLIEKAAPITFQDLDKDKDGQLKPEPVKNVLQARGFTEDEADLLVEDMFNREFTIDETAFDKAREAFQDALDADYFGRARALNANEFDTSGTGDFTGKISATGMKGTLMTKDPPWTEPEANRFVNEVCTCADQSLAKCAVDKAQLEKGIDCLTEQNLQAQALKMAFSDFDVNGDGVLTPDEIKQVLMGMGFTEEEADAFIKKLCEAAGMGVEECKLDQAAFERAMAALNGKSEAGQVPVKSEVRCAGTYGSGPGDRCPAEDGSRISTECPRKCQEFMDQVEKDCESGFQLQGDLTYGTYYTWGKFHRHLPNCKYTYTANACDIALEALDNAIYSTGSDFGTGECLVEINQKACTDKCFALIENFNKHCAESPTAFVPTFSTYKDKTYELVNFGPLTPKKLGLHQKLSQDCYNRIRVPGHKGEPTCADIKQHYGEDTFCEEVNGLMECDECMTQEEKDAREAKLKEKAKNIPLAEPPEDIESDESQFEPNVDMYRALKAQRSLEAAAEAADPSTAWKAGTQVAFHGTQEGVTSGQRGLLVKFDERTAKWLVDFGTLESSDVGDKMYLKWVSSMHLEPIVAGRTTAWKPGDGVLYHDPKDNTWKGKLSKYNKETGNWTVHFAKIPENLRFFGGKVQEVDPKFLTLDVAPKDSICWWQTCPVPDENQGEECTGTRSSEPVNSSVTGMDKNNCGVYYGPYITDITNRIKSCTRTAPPGAEMLKVAGEQYTASACYFQFTYRKKDDSCVADYQAKPKKLKLCKPSSEDLALDQATWQNATELRAIRGYQESWQDHKTPTPWMFKQFQTDGGFVYRNTDKKVVAVRCPRMSRSRSKPKWDWEGMFWRGKLLVGLPQELKEDVLEKEGILADKWVTTSEYMRNEGVKAMLWQRPCKRDSDNMQETCKASFCPNGCWGFDTGEKFIFFQVMPADERYAIATEKLIEEGGEVLWFGEEMTGKEGKAGELKGLAFSGGAFVLTTPIEAGDLGIFTDISERKSMGEQMWRASYEEGGDIYYGSVSQWAHLDEPRWLLRETGIPETAIEFAYAYPGEICDQKCVEELQKNYRPDDPTVGIPMGYTFDDDLAKQVKAMRVIPDRDKTKGRIPLIDIDVKAKVVKLYLFDEIGDVEDMKKVDLADKTNQEVEIINAVKYLMDSYAERRQTFHIDKPFGFIFARPDAASHWEDATCLARRVASSGASNAMGWKVVYPKTGEDTMEEDMQNIWKKTWGGIDDANLYEIEKGKIAGVETQLRPGLMRISLLCDEDYQHKITTKPLLEAIGQKLCMAMRHKVQIVTEGKKGPQRDFVKSFVECGGNKRHTAENVAQLTLFTSTDVVIGMNVPAGNDDKERSEVLTQIADVYIVVEGGDKVREMARAALKRPDPAIVLPLPQTKGASTQKPLAGMEPRAQVKQAGVIPESVWDTITKGEEHADVAGAIVELLKGALKQQTTLPRLRGIYLAKDERWRETDEDLVPKELKEDLLGDSVPQDA